MLTTLAAIFARLSLLAVGGGNTVLPEMQREVTLVHHWMSATEFASLFALAQAAPGPNILVATLIGWRVAGVPGALVATASMCGPSSLLSYGVGSVWQRFREARWRVVIQSGLTPLTMGLVAAGAWLVAAVTTTDWRAGLATVCVAALSLSVRVNPLVWLAGCALLGTAGVL